MLTYRREVKIFKPIFTRRAKYTCRGHVLQKRDLLSTIEQTRLEEISGEIKKFEMKLDALTTHTIEEAQQMVDYPINKPVFVPEGYQLINSTAHSDEEQPGTNPIVEYEYKKGEMGFRTFQLSIDKEDELDKWSFEHTDSYAVKGYKIDFLYSDETNVQGMRITDTVQNYKIVIIADLLSKQEMEKILLSMVSK